MAEVDWRQVAATQEGILSRAQAKAGGLTDSAILTQIRAQRWRRVFPGVYATFTGEPSDRAKVWAGLLYAGTGAIASHETAAWLQGVVDELPPAVHVTVPQSRRVKPQPGLRVHYCTRAAERRHPARTIPQTTVEETVLDRVNRASGAEIAIGIIMSACQRRKTTAARLASCATRRRKLRWRSLLLDVLTDVRDGAVSPLERRYRHRVEIAHGLPRATRNEPDQQGNRRRFRDVRYRKWSTVVELDGRAAHPDDERHRDMERDNEIAVEGSTHLRYGWSDVAGQPCRCAAQVAGVLKRNGWPGALVKCGPRCTALDPR